MKHLTAIIPPHMKGRVVRALHSLPDFPGFTLTDARSQHRRNDTARGPLSRAKPYYRRLMLQVVCADCDVDTVIDVLEEAVNSVHLGDATVVVSDVSQLLHLKGPGLRDDSADLRGNRVKPC